MTGNLNIGLAFAAGLLSFLSPCVLPLIPSYLAFLGGTGLPTDGGRRILVVRTLGFVSGFTVVFVILALVFTGSALLAAGASQTVSIVAGAIVILLGLSVISGFPSFLNYEVRPHRTRPPIGLPSSVVAGMSFGAGWSPCVGPILAGILAMAGQSGELPTAAALLSAYSLGLGLPFIAAAVFAEPMLKRLAGLRRHMPMVRRASGVLLVLIGLSIVAGKFQELTRLTFQTGYNLQDWVGNYPTAARLVFSLLPAALGGFVPAVSALYRKARPTAAALVVGTAFLALGLANWAGIVNLPRAATAWLSFQGI